MGWTITDLHRNRLTLEQAKQKHLASVINYGTETKAELIAHEWHAATFYALIRLERPGLTPVTFLRVDMIEQSPASFGYKDMSESMGPYVDDKPSAALG